MFKEIKGLKYPDEYLTKFFFKEGLDKLSNKTFLEFGCGNGSNLMLPYQYDNNVIGVDFDPQLIDYANDNFVNLQGNGNYQFHADDMRNFVTTHNNLQADVFLLPSVAYYISRSDFIQFLKAIKSNNMIKQAVPFYIRLRTPKDYRFGLGQKVDYNTYLMPTPSGTGEDGALMAFYEPLEMIDLLRENIDLREFKVFSLDCQNEQEGQVILNSDIVIWGVVN